MSAARGCCCGGERCEYGDCLSGAEVEDGCCHACDTLLMWCERPQTQLQQHSAYGGQIPGTVPCETCYTVTNFGLPPVQAIYKFYKSFYRCVFFDLTPTQLVTLPPSCPNCPGDPPVTDCCSTQFDDGNCQCFSFEAGYGGINSYRRAEMMSDDATKWFIEMRCFKQGQTIGGSIGVGSMFTEMLCLVYQERWWRIAMDCDGNVRIYVPGCNQNVGNPPTSNCGGIPFVESQLVPKYWIYACSGIPLYRWEVDEAIVRGVITGDEASSLLIDIGNKITPNQTILAKLGDAGYIKAGDWRAEQRQAYVDLHALYPSAGYGQCIQPVEQMHTLGPFRKRLTEPLVGVNNNALVRKTMVIPESAGLQADCFLPYAGDTDDQAAYNFWAERQWVYFRGVPGGWTWAGWSPVSDPACFGLGLTEEEAILRGCGRGDTGCLEAIKGNPRGPTQCTPCACINPAYNCCDSCTDDCELNCGPGAVTSCADGQLPVPTKCNNLSLLPLCEGVRFVYSVYAFKHTFTGNPVDGFEGDIRTICHYSVQSFLVELKRSTNSWSDSIPYKCRDEVPALGTFKTWPEIEGIHVGHFTICNPLSAGDFTRYDATDLCCGGICYTDEAPCWPLEGERFNCIPVIDCPPHNTQAQIACMGGNVPCTET